MATLKQKEKSANPSPPIDADVFIIGAGPAGLTAAYCLTKESSSVIVVEQDPVYVGGISRTVNHKGYLFDIGGHRFFSKSKEVVDLWREILPDDFVERPRLSRIYYGGKYYSYPLKAVEALTNLGIFQSIACMASYGWAKMFPIANPSTFHQWVRNAFGERLFSIFFKTYTEKVWGMSCDDISADWAAQRIKGLSLGAAIFNALARSFRGKATAKNSDVIKSLIESFQYPRKGPGMMWEACSARVEAQGGTVLMGRRFESMSWDKAEGVWTIKVSIAKRTEIFRARHVVSSAPLRELMEKIVPTPTSSISASGLRYRDFLTVALMVKNPDLFPDNWIYIHDPSVKVGRVQNFRSWSPELVPDSAMSCLGLEYFCFEGDGLWQSSDQELTALATVEIAKIGIVKPTEVTDSCVVRQSKAYPIYDEGYRARLAAIREDINLNYPTLHLVGRNGMHKYNNQDHAMMTAMLTARNILAGKRVFNIWDVNEDAEYHESVTLGERAALNSERLAPTRAQPNGVGE